VASSALLTPVEAWAKGGQWGVLEGKASSLVHPFVMASLLLVTLYSGYLGLQWRKTRELGQELSELRKKLPTEEGAVWSSEQTAIKAKVDELSAERSTMVKAQYKDAHYQLSSLILGGGVFFTAYGAFNTFFRAEKLFPGPHLYAGVALVVIWSLAASLVPYMEKGNDAARTGHIALNVLGLGLFVWQLPTGFDILLKVWGNDALPWF